MPPNGNPTPNAKPQYNSTLRPREGAVCHERMSSWSLAARQRRVARTCVHCSFPSPVCAVQPVRPVRQILLAAAIVDFIIAMSDGEGLLG